MQGLQFQGNVQICHIFKISRRDRSDAKAALTLGNHESLSATDLVKGNALLADYFENSYFNVFNNRDYRWSNELTIKAAFMSLLVDDTYYIMDSEAALQRRYADLLMIIRPDMRRLAVLKDVVLEFKYLSLADVGLTAEGVRRQNRETLQQMPVVQTALQAALLQLRDYQRVLVEKYREPQRLRCLAVVARYWR